MRPRPGCCTPAGGCASTARGSSAAAATRSCSPEGKPARRPPARSAQAQRPTHEKGVRVVASVVARALGSAGGGGVVYGVVGAWGCGVAVWRCGGTVACVVARRPRAGVACWWMRRRGA
eukprot:765509-Prymnesium_polylepis.1